MEFIMMVGIPGSGKDYFIEHNNYLRDFITVSTDQIRIDNGYKQGEKANVFEIAHKTIIDSLSLGKNVVFNATNLQRKFRVNLLHEIHSKFPDCYCKAYVILVPIKLCKERNAQRDEFGRVPDEVIDHMVNSFQIPLESEGFDMVIGYYPSQDIYCDSKGYIKKEYASIDLDVLNDFDQDNPFHSLTLGQHMQATYDYVKNHLPTHLDVVTIESLLTAAKFHDIGKLITKGYFDRKGNPSKTAHYYGHENAGAYIVLVELNHIQPGLYNLWKVATYINFHMRVSFTWRQYPNGKCAKREKQLFNDIDLQCLELLGEADRQAH